MIAKLNFHNAIYGALAYNFQKINKGTAKILMKNKDLPYDKIKSIYVTMKDEANSRRFKTPLMHISLNFSPNIILNEEEIAQYTMEYINKIQYHKNTMCFFYIKIKIINTYIY